MRPCLGRRWRLVEFCLVVSKCHDSEASCLCCFAISFFVFDCGLFSVVWQLLHNFHFSPYLF